MNEYLISMYIDNELDLDEKIEFVETVYKKKEFKDEAVDLLDQEKFLQGDMVSALPRMQIPEVSEPEPNMFRSWFAPLAGFAAAMVLVAAVFVLRPDQVISIEKPYRFVIYHPATSQAEIIGTFTNWSAVPMQKVGMSGYWEITLDVSEGEHRYSYLVENGRQIADPTVLVREQDDFGGENSIIRVDVAI